MKKKEKNTTTEKGITMKDFEEYEPTEEELKEIEELLTDMELEEAKEDLIYKIIRNRKIQGFSSFDSFKAWLKTNGIRW